MKKEKPKGVPFGFRCTMQQQVTDFRPSSRFGTALLRPIRLSVATLIQSDLLWEGLTLLPSHSV